MAQHHNIIPMTMVQHNPNNNNILTAIVHPNSIMQIITHYHHNNHILLLTLPCNMNILLVTPHYNTSIPMGWTCHQCPLGSMGHMRIGRDEKFWVWNSNVEHLICDT